MNSRLLRACGFAAFVLLPLVSVDAEETLRPAAQRFLADTVEETPDFQRHIVPLLGRQGCNGRSCHGSFQGRGGLRLSLFGYDMKFDLEALTKLKGEADELRVNLKKPTESLMLVKASDASMHEGGEKLKKGSWEYRLFAKWIECGCPGPRDGLQLARLQVEPSEIRFTAPGQTVQLKVTAFWKDGVSEDVTCLSRFRTNSEAVAEIDSFGKVTSLDKGDTHVVAFYDNGVVAVPVLLPIHPEVVTKYPPQKTSTKIDGLIVDKLKKLGVVPSDVCNDTEFLRRVSLDVVGSLPTPAEVEGFAADRSADKRAHKVEELLARPEYAAWWATKLCDLTGNNPQQMGDNNFRQEQSLQWYQWLEARLSENMPYDKIVEGMFLSVSRRPGQSFNDYTLESTHYLRKDEPESFADYPSMPHYWSRNTFRKPEDRVLGFSYAFLGIRIQCAQCHKHPFDQWTQQDYQEFTKFFTRVNYGYDRDARDTATALEEKLGLKGKNGAEQRKILVETAKKGDPIPLREVYLTPAPPPVKIAKSTGKKGTEPVKTVAMRQPARLLGAETLDLATLDDPRTAVMDWLRRKDNPFFVKALVNRIWAHYFGLGIIEPADDLNLANPPSNGPLLDYLSQGFIRSGYDLKWLHREIVSSAAYQRTWRTNETNEGDRRNFSHMLPRRLPAEVAYDAVLQATTSSKKLAAVHDAVEKRAISHASTTGAVNRYAVQVFGKPERATTCDCERSGEPTLLQAVFLQNDREMLQLIERGGWLAEVAQRCREPLPGSGVPVKSKGKPEPMTDALRDEFIQEAFLRTLSRDPSAAEVARARQHFTATATTSDGVRDLLWALLNTREFIVNH